MVIVFWFCQGKGHPTAPLPFAQVFRHPVRRHGAGLGRYGGTEPHLQAGSADPVNPTRRVRCNPGCLLARYCVCIVQYLFLLFVRCLSLSPLGFEGNLSLLELFSFQ